MSRITAEARKSLESEYFSAQSPAIAVSDAETFVAEMTCAINLCFREPEPQTKDELADLSSARELFRQSVLERTIRNEWAWLALLGHVATHLPKTHNDKVGTPGIWATVPIGSIPTRGAVSHSSFTSRSVSAAGNASNTKHYKILSMVFCFPGEADCTLIDLFARDDVRVRTAFASLGMSNTQWESLNERARERIASTEGTCFLDRQLKQLFVPIPSGDKSHTLVTPLPATKVVAALEFRQRELRARAGWLPLFRTKIGGTKPQNAGTLVSELGGNLAHLQARFPEIAPQRLIRVLYKLAHRGVFPNRSSDEIKELREFLCSDWSKHHSSRQAHIKSISKKVLAVLQRDLDDLLTVREAIAEEAGYQKLDELLSHGGLQRIAPWLMDFLRGAEERLSHLELLNTLIKAAQKSLSSNWGVMDDSHARLLEDAIQDVIGDFVNEL